MFVVTGVSLVSCFLCHTFCIFSVLDITLWCWIYSSYNTLDTVTCHVCVTNICYFCLTLYGGSLTDYAGNKHLPDPCNSDGPQHTQPHQDTGQRCRHMSRRQQGRWRCCHSGALPHVTINQSTSVLFHCDSLCWHIFSYPTPYAQK